MTGKVLVTMKKDDWKELGVVKFGDLRTLEITPIRSNNVSAAPPIKPTSSQSDVNHQSRISSLEGMDDVGYKPIIKLVGGDYKPTRSCHDHILNDLPSIFVDVPNIPSILKECMMVAESRLEHLPSDIPRLTEDESLAIAAYSFDLGIAETERNLYYSLNSILRERDPFKMTTLKPFLSYLMSGLFKLPPMKSTVFRGIPKESMKMIQEKYRDGLNIHWSGFTSTTNNIKKAKSFAQQGGIIFRIRILAGRNIRHYSAIPSEDEVLLSPNIKLIVIASVHKEDDGFFYVDLQEQVQGASFIY